MKKDDITALYTPDFIQEIKRIVTNARQKAYAAINSAMVEAYWQMGKRIVEQEQQGKDRADYGSQLLKSLSKELTAEFGKGFSRQLVVLFPSVLSCLSRKTPHSVGNFDVVTLQASVERFQCRCPRMVSERGRRTDVELPHARPQYRVAVLRAVAALAA